MSQIQPLLAWLDELYRADNLDAYEHCWQEACQRIERLFPGYTLAYAEIYTTGQKRIAHGGMRHVLLPTERNAQ